MIPSARQLAAREQNGRRSKGRWVTLARTRRQRPSDTLPRLVPLHLAAADEDRLPSLCRCFRPDGTLRVVLDPFTRKPVAR